MSEYPCSRFERRALPRFELHTGYVSDTHVSQIFRCVQHIIIDKWLALSISEMSSIIYLLMYSVAYLLKI